MTRRLAISGMAMAIALVAGQVAAETPDRAALERTVAAQHDATVQALRDWIALPTIAAEKRGTPEGA